jgi:hypothetical protein
MGMNMIKLSQKFSSPVDRQEEQVLLRVHGDATGVWTAEVSFDRFDEMYLAGGWMRFCHVHQIKVGHFLVFNYGGNSMLTVSVFDKTMCRHHNNAAANNSNSDDE